MAEFSWRSELPADAATAYAWHAAPGALDRLLPPWQPIRVVARSGKGVDAGARVTLELRYGPFRTRWVAEHRDPAPGRSFSDVQLRGPFKRWHHVHRFAPTGKACSLEDLVDYELPGGPLGRLAAPAVRHTLERTFRFRHERTRRDLLRLRLATGASPMRVAVTGANGLLGTALVAFLRTGGHEVLRLVRRAPQLSDEVAWRPDVGEIDARALEGVEVVVHLAGENIGAGRWGPRRRRAIIESRRAGTTLLAGALARLSRPPRTLVAASAVGIYGDRGNEEVDESSRPGRGFLAEVTQLWESACHPASAAGIRVVNLRFGVVMAARGGALARMLPAFRVGAGGRLGSGRQWMSWVSLDDAIGAVHHALVDERLSGPVNVVAPAPVRNATFARTLGAVLHRPAIAPVPAPLLRLAFGELAEETLLGGAHVVPRVLLDCGFTFLDSTLEGALRFELGS